MHVKRRLVIARNRLTQSFLFYRFSFGDFTCCVTAPVPGNQTEHGEGHPNSSHFRSSPVTLVSLSRGPLFGGWGISGTGSQARASRVHRAMLRSVSQAARQRTSQSADDRARDSWDGGGGGGGPDGRPMMVRLYTVSRRLTQCATHTAPNHQLRAR